MGCCKVVGAGVGTGFGEKIDSVIDDEVGEGFELESGLKFYL